MSTYVVFDGVVNMIIYNEMKILEIEKKKNTIPPSHIKWYVRQFYVDWKMYKRDREYYFDYLNSHIYSPIFKDLKMLCYVFSLGLTISIFN